MNKILGLAACAAMLAACDDRGAVDEVSAGTTTTTPSEVVSNGTVSVGDVGGVALAGDVLQVSIALDGDDVLEEYDLTGNVVNGYQEYEQQATGLNRAFTAIAGESSDGSIVAVVTADGGQFNRFFGGATVVQNSLSAPESGLVSYAGDYAGVNNGGAVIPSGVVGAPDILDPSGTGTVTGTVFLTADFADNKVEGAVYGRMWVGVGALDDLTLINGDISDAGTFSGSAEVGQGSTATTAGSYTGAFGGEDAAVVGGLLDVGPGGYGADADPNIREYGIFVLDQCADGNPENCF